jgi:GABA permease
MLGFSNEMSSTQRQVLTRTLRPRHIQMISIGGIIGAGLFVGSGAAIAAVGPAVIISYFVAGLVILCVMRMISEMAAANLGLSSFTEYTRLALGHWAGFVTGWLYWYFWVVVIAIEAIAGASIISQWIRLPVWEIGLALMFGLTCVNLMSARSYGEFEFWFSSIKVAAIVAFIVLGIASLGGLRPVSGAGLANLTGHGGFAPKGLMAVVSGVTTVIFALCGAEIATIAAVESREPTQIISRLTFTIVIRILMFYVLSVAVIVAIVPWDQIKPGLSPFTLALERLSIPGVTTLMNFIILVAVLSCLNSGVYVTSRVLFVLAAHGDAPDSMVSLSSRRVPVRAILLGSAFGYCAVIASVVSPTRVFAFLVNASGALMLIIYLLLAFSQWRMRRRLEALDPARLSVRMWGFPWLTWLVIVAIIAILLSMLWQQSTASELYSSLVCVSIVAVSCAIRMRRGIARWQYVEISSAPVPNHRSH